jgi:hypothetical protein
VSKPESQKPKPCEIGRQWLREEVSKQMHTSPTFGMLADLENLAEPFFLGEDLDEDDSDFDEGPF